MIVLKYKTTNITIIQLKNDSLGLLFYRELLLLFSQQEVCFLTEMRHRYINCSGRRGDLWKPELLFMENVLYAKNALPDLPVDFSQNIIEGLLCCLEPFVLQVFYPNLTFAYDRSHLN